MPLLIWKVRKGWKGYLSVLRGIIKYVLCSRYMLFWLDIGMDIRIFREKHTSIFYRLVILIFSVDWLELIFHVSGLISVVCSSRNLILQLQLNQWMQLSKSYFTSWVKKFVQKLGLKNWFLSYDCTFLFS